MIKIEKSTNTTYDMNKIQKCYEKSKNSDTKHHILHDYMYIKYPEEKSIEIECKLMEDWLRWWNRKSLSSPPFPGTLKSQLLHNNNL